MKKILLIPIILLASSLGFSGLKTSYFGPKPEYQKLFINQTKEVMYFIMSNGLVVTVTSERKEAINQSLKIRVKDIKVVIHNHLAIRKFSNSDKEFYLHLLEKGFKGKFLLYVKPRIYELRRTGK